MLNSDISEEQANAHHQILTFQLSWNCNAACRHCMYSSQENRSRVMSLNEAKRILDQLQQLPLTSFVGFTGGEAFLYYDLLLELGRYIQRKYGYGFGIATNCFWAEDRSKARTLLGALVEVGLAQLLVSLDDFHLQFVDGKCVENCVHAALDLGIQVTIQTITAKTGHTSAYFQEHMDVPRPPAVQWVDTPLHPAGRARSQVADSDYIYDWTNRPGRCTALRVWNVDPSGWVTPCCGTAFARPLRVGNALREDLSSIVRRANVNPLLNTLAAWGGPYLLIKILEQQGDHRYSNRLFASNCHACDVVLRDARAVEICKRELAGRWLDALASRLAAHTLWYRSVVLHDESSNLLPAGWLAPDSTPVPAECPPASVAVARKS